MKVVYTKKFIRLYRKQPQHIQEAMNKQLGFLLSNVNHPSLNIKKMQGYENIWEGRITQSYRFTFQKQDDVYIFRTIGAHDILKNP